MFNKESLVMNVSISDPISSAISTIGTILTRVLPDKSVELQGEIDNALAQIQVDNTEAMQPGLMGQWRDALGWVCVMAFIWQYVMQPVITYFASLIIGHPPVLPPVDTSQLVTLMLGMLGMSGFHMYQQTQMGK